MTDISEPQVRSRSIYYEGLRGALRSRILDVLPGERLPGDRELARELGTSKITVGHILQEFQSEGLLERIPGKGTFLRDPGRTRQIPTLVPAIENGKDPPGGSGRAIIESSPVPARTAGIEPLHVLILAVMSDTWSKSPDSDRWSRRLASSVERRLQSNGCRTMVRNQFGVLPEKIDDVFQGALDAGVNGVIYMPTPLKYRSWEATWEDRLLRYCGLPGSGRMPLVQIAWDVDPYLPFSAIRATGESGSFLATQHLIHQGHREIAFVAPSLSTPDLVGAWVIHRIRGFRRALQMAGIDEPTYLGNSECLLDSERIIFADPTPDGVDRWPVAGRSSWPYIQKNPKLTAVVAANDSMAASIIEEATKSGVGVPRDLSVVGFDNTFFSPQIDLTTVNVPIEEMGEAAASLLLNQANAQSNERIQILFDPTLVIRGTTSPPTH